MSLENTKTMQNLINAFAGESQAQNRYTMYSKIAAEEGYEKICEVFMKTADNEYEHAKLFYKYIPVSSGRKVDGIYPFYTGSTLDNLLEASKAEQLEWEHIYAKSYEIAREEGFTDISNLFCRIIEIEKRHAYRFNLIASRLKDGLVFSKTEQTQWICRKCGYVQISKEAPLTCPVCTHPQGCFEIFNDVF